MEPCDNEKVFGEYRQTMCCDTCKFWEHTNPGGSTTGYRDGFGDCHRRSPVIVLGMISRDEDRYRRSDLSAEGVRAEPFHEYERATSAVWPETSTEDYCGDWEPNAEWKDIIIR